MRTLTVTEFVSLDGVMDSPGGEAGYPHAGWVGPRFTDELGAFKLEEQLAAEILLLGRRTYESFVGAWPQREGPMADKINTMRKIVASTTLSSSDWENTTIIASDLAGNRSTRSNGRTADRSSSPAVAPIVHALLEAGLVDELNLQVFPLILGSGIRVYPDRPEPIALELTVLTHAPEAA